MRSGVCILVFSILDPLIFMCCGWEKLLEIAVAEVQGEKKWTTGFGQNCVCTPIRYFKTL